MIFKTETAVKRDAENFVLRYLDKRKSDWRSGPAPCAVRLPGKSAEYH